MFCASVLLASCAAIFDDDKTPVNSGEVETSYIAINLMATDPDTRAGEGDSTDGTTEEPTPTYQAGTADERAVKTAYFFFFQNGVPFPVTVTDGSVTAPATTGANFLSATLTSKEEAASKDNVKVSDVKNVVLLLKNYKGQYPNQIIAVLNWVPEDKPYEMEDLAKVVDIQTTMQDSNGISKNYFVMSNAVYADAANQAVTATPLTYENIYTNEDHAKANPVNIYVERIAAKVTVTAPADKKFDLKRDILASASSVKAYAVLTGWELYNEFDKSYLLKQIVPTWDAVNTVGFNWNDPSFFRSYWAKSPDPDWGENNTFKWSGGLEFGSKTSVDAGTYASNTYVYCGENTTNVPDDRTKVILKARLVDDKGATLELARWYGTEYLGEGNLRTAVANTLKNNYYYEEKEGETIRYTSIDPTDLQCVVGGGEGAPKDVNATEVYFQLSTDKDKGVNKVWYEYSSANGYVKLEEASKTNAELLNEKLKKVPSAVLYKNGQTYYFFDIKHLGAAGKDAEYGIVRNHIYNININSIGGYGSPVYNGLSNIENPKYPEVPTDEGSYVSAKVNILSWRMVSQGVNIQPQPGN